MKDNNNLKNKKKVILIAGIIVILLVVVIWAICSNAKGTNVRKEKQTTIGKETVTNEDGSAVENDESETSADGMAYLKEGESPEDVSVQVKKSDDFVVPGEGTLEIDKIQGFNPQGSSAGENETKKDSDDSNHSSENESKNENANGDNQKIILSDSNLVVEEIGDYTGIFVEDGSDETIKNVAALIVTNNSDQMLQVGDIVFQVNEKETATFRVTNLLPKASVIVLESNKRTYNEKDDYSYGKVTNSYIDAPTTLLEDQFELIRENGKLTLKNKTDETYKKVYVYYKYARIGGVYMGGITYRVPFENIEGNASVESVANHFNKDSSIIVDVQIAEK